MKFQLLLLVAALMLTEYTPPVRSECCHSAKSAGNVLGIAMIGYCCDGTGATPYCGYGECNIFGCNCDGGCRRGHLCNNRKRRSAEQEASAALAQFDVDGDGRVSLDEATSSMARNLRLPVNRVSVSRLERSFYYMDLNSDGFISLQEVDPTA